MRTRRYLNSLRVRIVLAITSLALISALIYSTFAWFIYDVSDDRLFNWYALSINKQAVSTAKLPVETDKMLVVVGNEKTLIQVLNKRFNVLPKAVADLPEQSGDQLSHRLPSQLSDFIDVSNVAVYDSGHVIFDVEAEEGGLDLQIVASPWQNKKLFVVYDISGFSQEENPNSLYADKFVLYVLIPLALLITLLALLLSIGLTKGILRPLTKLANRVTSIKLDELSTPLVGRYYPDEVGELAETFNQLIRKIDEYIEHEKLFSREVSHELRTPTTSLTMALDLFESTELTAQQKTLFARMQRANKDMTQLINTFLWLAKNHPENAPISPVKLHHFFKQMLEKLSYLSENKPVTVINQVATTDTCITNTALLEIVVSNLLRNALQYTQKGEVRIISDVNSFSIIDTGLGIPASEMNNINQPFYSLQPDGVGLGMSIVQRIIRKLDWQLQVTSVEGKGTKMTVIFEE